MTKAEGTGVSCAGCPGTCCTFEANSMMVTPHEAVDLFTWLREEGKLTPELREKLERTVRDYRLDHAPGNGKRSFLRKTYTCTFFNFTELGCPLPREVKPYGCLAFNSHHPEEKAGSHCYSDKNLLENLDFPELDQELKKSWGIFWDKSPLPTALLDLWSKI